jgi:flagellar basal body-associated protein FliL
MNDNNKEILQEEPMKKKPVFLIVVVIALVCAVGYLGYTYLDLRKQSAIEKEELTRQREKLETELRVIYVEYDSLKSDNDTMNLKLQAEQDRIERLLKINANNVYKIRMYEKELQTIRKVLRSYVVQIDSLNMANQELRAQNIEVRQQLHRSETEKAELSQAKEELSSKVEMASILNAKNIVVTALRNEKGRETDRYDKTIRLRICFTLRENPILEPGFRTVYMRIARPDDVILTSGVNFFDFEGQQIVYTASREVSYENVDVDLCLYWQNDGQLIPGTYSLTLYAGGHMIGSTTFALK